jgi:hypothetical protein
MTKITLHDSQEPFTPNRDRAPGFYRDAKPEDVAKFDPQGEPEAVDMPMFLQEPSTEPEPQTDYEAIIAELKAQLAAKDAPKWSADEEPPAELSDLISYYDTPAEANDRLIAMLREVNGLIGLAEDRGGRAEADLYRKRDRIESGIRWNRGRLSGTI